MGPQGSGKTTLLEDLAAEITAAGRPVTLLRASRGMKPALLPGHIILLDSAERLSAASWLRFRFHARRAAGLIITAHHPGRLPPLVCLTTTPARLAEGSGPQRGSCHGVLWSGRPIPNVTGWFWDGPDG